MVSSAEILCFEEKRSPSTTGSLQLASSQRVVVCFQNKGNESTEDFRSHERLLYALKIFLLPFWIVIQDLQGMVFCFPLQLTETIPNSCHKPQRVISWLCHSYRVSETWKKYLCPVKFHFRYWKSHWSYSFVNTNESLIEIFIHT